MAFTLSSEAIDNLSELLPRYTQYNINGRLRDRFQLVDRYIQRSMDTEVNAVAARVAARAGDRTKLQNMELPICMQQLGTAHSRLVGTFLTGYPIFSMVATHELQDVALMYNALIERDQERFKWVPHLSRSLRHLLKYNVMAVEVDYTTQHTNQLRINGKEREIAAISYSGNKLRSIDPYNFLFDPTVPLHELAEFGTYAGYVYRRNYIAVKMFLNSLQDTQKEYCILKHFNTALDNSTAGAPLYHTPDVHPLEDRNPEGDQWEGFFGFTAPNTVNGATNGRYEIVVLYARLIPNQFGIVKQLQKEGHPTPFKLIYVSGILVYCEPLRHAHGLLPIVAAHGYDDDLGWQNNSFVENLMDMQDGGSALWNGSIASMRRAVGDRALFNPLLVKPSDVNSSNPVAKIPVRSNAYNGDLSRAYMSIPYNDSVSPQLQGNMQLVLALSNQITGLNPASQGNFVKGNKTQSEYSDVMQNSEARMMQFSLDAESLAFAPLKRMIKLNYMQYASKESVMMRSQRKMAEIEPEKLLQQEADFKVADGIFPVGKAVNTEAFVAAINGTAQMPELDIKYNRADMMVYMIKTQGVDLSQFERPPEEQKQRAEQMAAQAAAAQGKPGTPPTA